MALTGAVANDSTLYGMTGTGKIVALDAASGVVRWQTTGSYVGNRLVLQDQRLLAYREYDGLCFIDDAGASATERLVASFGILNDTLLATPALDGRMYHFIVNQGLYAGNQDSGLQFGTTLNEDVPHVVTVIAPGEIVVISSKAIPSRYRVGSTYQLVWEGEQHGIHTGQTEAKYAVAGDVLVLSAGRDIVAYNLGTGRIMWRIPGRPVQSFAVQGNTVYGAFVGATVRAIDKNSGRLLWERQYVYNTSGYTAYGITAIDDYLYVGGLHQVNADGAYLFSLDAANGSLRWASRSANGRWAGGLPVTDGTRVFCCGAAVAGCYEALPFSPRVTTERIAVMPLPLRGDPGDFGQGRVTVDLPTAARVSISAYRERAGLGASLVAEANWSVGTHEISWDPKDTGGFAADNQFGFILVDVEESGRSRYTQACLTPVNTFPDVLWHWAKGNIETLVYHRFVSGYEDQTFRPDNLVTRAEGCTIIAKTLGLDGPSAGFHSRLTDISTHWARSYIMALEERGVVGGFLEPDGSYTFRPDLYISRGQEARILVRAYNIPAAPPGFRSSFRDIQGHWAEADISALESAGYVNGFDEGDGSKTYRPEQNLTRAELCTVIVRIRRLSR